MENKPVMRSVLDTDLYKLTMGQAIFMLYPRAEARFELVVRSKSLIFPANFANAVRTEIKAMSSLALSQSEKCWLSENYKFFYPTYLDFLEGYRFNPLEVEVQQDGAKLTIKAQGPYYRVTYWETPILAIIEELVNRMCGFEAPKSLVIERSKEKADGLIEVGLPYAEFGTRRRFSYDSHVTTLETLQKYSKNLLVGTSNVHLAHMMGLKAIGTQAHEWYSFHAAKYGYRMANEMGMKAWVDVYKGDLGIVLPDTFTTAAFLNVFNTMYSKLFDGVRWDSGDPWRFVDSIFNHYINNRVDPASKSIIFSNGINSIDMCHRIRHYCQNRVKASLAIGQWLLNDFDGIVTKSVMKLVAAKPDGMGWTDTCKISDDVGKHTGSPEAIRLCKDTLKLDI